MAQDIQIDIKTTADTVGAEAVTDALDVVAEKAQDVQEAQVGTRGFNGQLDESLKETKKEAEKLTTATKALTTATKDLATESKTAATGELELSREMREAGQAADVRTIKLRQSAVSIGQISQALGPAISGLKNFAIESKNSDLENLATGFQSLNGAVGLAAQGFAAGGPLGAIIGGIAGLAAPILKKEIDDLGKSLANVAELEGVSAGLPMRIAALKIALGTKTEQQGWKDLAREIDLTITKAEAAARVAEARRQSAEVEASNALTLARAGGDEKKIKAAEKNLNATRQNNEQAKLDDDLAESSRKLKASQTELEQKQRELAGNQTEVLKNTNLMDAAEKNLKAATEDLAAKRKKDAQAGPSVGLISPFKPVSDNVIKAEAEVKTATDELAIARKVATDNIKALAEAEAQARDAVVKAKDAFKKAAVNFEADAKVINLKKNDAAQTVKTGDAADAANKTIDLVTAALTDVLGKIPEAIKKTPAVTSLAKQINDALKGGVDNKEAEEVLTALRQLATKTEGGQQAQAALIAGFTTSITKDITARTALLTAVTNNTKAAATANAAITTNMEANTQNIGTLISTVSGLKSTIAAQARQISALQNAAQNQ